MELTAPGGTAEIEFNGVVARITLSRPDSNNAINNLMINDLHSALNYIEARGESVRVIIIQARGPNFCTGMDFQAVADDDGPTDNSSGNGELFLGLLDRFTHYPRIIIALVNGKVTAGGIGLAAASDLVLCTEKATFSLPEALWGLMPCCVLPFLIRRTGFQAAYRMTLTTQSLSAQQAKQSGLADEVAADPEAEIRKLCSRLGKLEITTIANIKRYFTSLQGIPDQTRNLALNELSRLMLSPVVKQNIHNFVNNQIFPWETC